MLRKKHRELTPQEQELIDQLHGQAQDLQDIMDILPANRERDVAMTRLEEAVMWAMKSVIES
jgi:hypothetical protein